MNSNIRNFCIIAHIDHGKSTLADCLLYLTETIPKQKYLKDQLLDNMDLEIEKGITIKSHPIHMTYNYKNKLYKLNLIDTPGHVDFSYEVSRSISACEGALLVVDASQGIQAQTISSLYLALEKNLKIIPILNKIDIPNLDYNYIINDIASLINCETQDILKISAKNRLGIHQVLDAIITNVPSPNISINSPLQIQIFDLFYDTFKGVGAYFRVWNGKIYENQKIKSLLTDKVYNVNEIGVLKYKKFKKKILYSGDVGYLYLGIKNFYDVKIGDTLTSCDNPSTITIPLFQEIKPMIFSGIYPENKFDYDHLKSSIQKLSLSDSSFSFIKESSSSLGYGFRCGFLGVLHMEIFEERLKREHFIKIIKTSPNVTFKILLKNNKYLLVDSPQKFPNKQDIKHIEEPYIRARIITITNYIGPIISLCVKKRGFIKNQEYISSHRIKLTFDLPLLEVAFDFYTKLKTISKGYSSFDYEYIGYRKSNLVKLDILVNKKIIDTLSVLIHSKNAYNVANKICDKLLNIIYRHQFNISIQASIYNKIIVRKNIKAFRKDVIGKCYGGDFSRKRKLLEKQKKGKKKMQEFGKINIPSNAYSISLNDI